MGMIPLCVAIYARVSSEQQATSSTIDSQIAALEARLAQDGLALMPEGRFTDEGYSGATLVRPALERLRDAVAAGNLDRLYVHSPDRLARRYAYQVLLIDEFHRAGVEIIFLNRPIGLSPEDDLLLQVQGMVAEYERAKILERSRRGKRHAARQGAVSVLSGAPYGYRYVGKRDGGVARYEILEDEARIVRRIFAWIGRERVSIGETCRRLQQEGIRTRSGKPAWDRSTVGGILRNPAYAGTAAFGKTRIGPMPARVRPVRGGSQQPRRAHGVYDVAPGEWISVPVPPLVEEELFEAAREQLAENRRRNRQHAHGQRYLLQGLIKCQQCGYAYYGKAISLRSAKGKRRAYAYYRCCGSDADRFGGERLCANPQVRTDRLDEAVWREVERVLQDPSWIAAEYERRLDQARDPTTVNLAGLEAQIAKLRRGMGRLIDGYAEGLIDKADFEPRVAGLRQRIKSWDEQATTLRDEVAQRAALSLVVGRLQDFVRQVRDRMSAVDWSLQRDLIRVLVKRVEIDRGDINVVFRVAPSFDPGYGGSQDDRSLHHRGRSEDPALRRAARTALATAHARLPITVPLLDRCPQPQLDEPQHVPVNDPPGDRLHQLRVRDRVEVFRQISIDHVGVAPADVPVHVLDRVGSAPSRAVALGTVLEVRLEDRPQHQLGGGLNHPVPNGRDAERPLAAPRLGDHHPPHRRGPVRLRDEVSAQACQPLLQPVRLDPLKRVPVHPRRAPVGAGERVGVTQDVRAMDLVVEQVEAEGRLRLRLEIQLSLEGPDPFGCLQARHQSPHPRRRRKHARSQGPSLRRRYPASAVP